MIYMLVVFNKQQKHWKKKKKNGTKRNNNKIIAAKKDELEIMFNQRTAEILKQKKNSKTPWVELRATQSNLYTPEKWPWENLPQDCP